MLTKNFSCQRARKMHFNTGWQNHSNASSDIKCISTCVDQMPMSTQNASLHVLPMHPIPVRTLNVSQNVMTKPLLCQRWHKMHHMCWANAYNASEESQNVSQNVLTKPLQCQRGHKMLLNMCWPNPFHGKVAHKFYLNMRLSSPYSASEDTKCILTCVDQILPMPARTENISQHVFKKSVQWNRWHKMHFNMCWPKPSHASKDIRFISTCFDQNSPMSAMAQN